MDAAESCLATPRQSDFWRDRLFAALGVLYCRTFHKAISRPVNGRYRCWRCLREFELEW